MKVASSVIFACNAVRAPTLFQIYVNTRNTPVLYHSGGASRRRFALSRQVRLAGTLAPPKIHIERAKALFWNKIIPSQQAGKFVAFRGLNNHKHTFAFLLLTVVLLTITTDAFCDTAEDYVNGSSQKYARGDLDGAIADCTKAIELKPDYANAYSSRGIAKLAKGDFNGAIEDYTKVIGLNPNSEDAYNNLGFAKRNLGDLDGAIADYTKAIELNPTNANVYNYCGAAKLSKGDFDGAISDNTKAIQLKPDYADAYLVRGLAKQRKGDLEGAIADQTKVIELNPENGNAYNNRGLSRRTLGDLNGAIADYTKAIELKPDNEGDHYSRGCLYYGLHEFTNALVDFQIVIKQNPPSDYPRFWVWLIRARLGETKVATTELQTYLAGRNTGNPNDWASEVGRFLAGQMAEQELLVAAKNPDLKTEAAQMCNFYFYAGSKHLFAGDKDTTTDYFKKCIATGKRGYLEYIVAAAELKLLKAEKN